MLPKDSSAAPAAPQISHVFFSAAPAAPQVFYFSLCGASGAANFVTFPVTNPPLRRSVFLGTPFLSHFGRSVFLGTPCFSPFAAAFLEGLLFELFAVFFWGHLTVRVIQ